MTDVTYLIDEYYYFGNPPTLSQALATYGLNTTTAQQYKWAKNWFREDKIVSGGGGSDWYDDGEVKFRGIFWEFSEKNRSLEISLWPIS